jgi:hypothetical protein
MTYLQIGGNHHATHKQLKGLLPRELSAKIDISLEGNIDFGNLRVPVQLRVVRVSAPTYDRSLISVDIEVERDGCKVTLHGSIDDYGRISIDRERETIRPLMLWLPDDVR